MSTGAVAASELTCLGPIDTTRPPLSDRGAPAPSRPSSPSLRTCSASAWTAAPADGGRSWARFASIARSGASSSGGTSAHTPDARGGSSRTCIIITSIIDSAWKSSDPVSISWAITPSA
ncbi:hypothetical protein SCE1572_20040 [Sorangium cellulosum So0157-2]|uniref:Uncharacterized protein n=1 Tax=Sorangium cellulosum So0157-2 TaxID=1254432 RepID=S4XTR6_SORCE|nr:hypothetical protein [Sorangium cellulosum]AGP36582.1 hypothetical protein SCE1572_20040 [Sorangium cellulosum So0157-2]